MKKNKNRFPLDLSKAKLTKTCLFRSELTDNKVLNSLIVLGKRGIVISSIGTIEDPNVLIAYEYTYETTVWAGRKIYIILNKYRGKEYFLCLTLVKEDINEVMLAYASTVINFFAKAA
jgi:hypothetical protein